MAGNKKGISMQETSLFFASLAMLLQAGMHPEECAHVMAEDMAATPAGRVAKGMEAAFETGQIYSVSDALQSTGEFSAYAIQMIQLGEISGGLENCARELGHYYYKQDIVDKNIRKAILSPLMLLGIMGGVIFFFVYAVLPVFEKVFIALNVMDVGSWAFSLARGLVGMLWLVFAVLLLAFLLAKTPLGKRALQNGVLGRKVYNDVCLSRLAQGISILLYSGISPERAVEKAAVAVVQNKTLCKKIEACQQRLAAGEDLGHVMLTGGVLYGMEAKMLLSASRTGQQSAVMSRLAQLYADNATARIERILGWLEPVLVALMCAMVGGVLLAMLLPLAQMASIL